MFYLLADPETSDAFVVSDDDGVPKAFKTESDAIKEANEFSASFLVLRPVARITEVTTHKVEKIK